MNSDTSYAPKARASRGMPGIGTPKGALIICTYLVGMTGIAAGAYTMREPDFNPPKPVAFTDVGDRMALPAMAPERQFSPSFGTRPQQVGRTPDMPRLAALVPSDTRIDADLVSRLSRVFSGQPSLVPPARPSLANTPDVEEARPETGIVEVRPTEEEDVLTASLRPRLRPTGLAQRVAEPAATSEAETLRLASLGPELMGRAVPEPDTARVPGTPAIASPNGTCPSRLASDVPRRKGDAPGAHSFMASVQSIDGVKRDQQVLREILKGNMPRFLRNLVPVDVSGRAGDGRDVRITLCVTPDYLALGSDRDYVRVPLGLRAATRIGEEFNMILPTPRMVDMIYRAAAVRLSPQPMTPGPQMTSTAYFMRHNDTVEAQRQSAGVAPGTLISGHKKDVVLTTRLASNRGKVAIYGWHRRNGRPIQPLSTVHGAGYADYSHGVRLVSRTAFLDGRAVDLQSLMADPRYAGLLSNEGPIGGPRLQMAALAAN